MPNYRALATTFAVYLFYQGTVSRSKLGYEDEAQKIFRSKIALSTQLPALNLPSTERS